MCCCCKTRRGALDPNLYGALLGVSVLLSPEGARSCATWQATLGDVEDIILNLWDEGLTPNTPVVNAALKVARRFPAPASRRAGCPLNLGVRRRCARRWPPRATRT